MSRTDRPLIVLVVNDALDHWCDYATQTIRYLAASYRVIVFCSGDSITWKSLFIHHPPRHRWGARLFYPFFIVPWQRFSFIKRCNYWINAYFLSFILHMRFKNDKKFFWFFDPINMGEIFPHFRSYVSVYDCVDYYHDISPMLAKTDRYLLACATHVVVNSFTLKAKLQQYRGDITVVPLGFALDIFSHATQNETKFHTPMTVGFVGGITKRIDFPLLLTVVTQCPHIRFVFYGPVSNDLTDDGDASHDFKVLFRLPNVHWGGHAAKSAMPNIIGAFDIGIIPYRTTDTFNKFCFPMKVMEYFYMGKPVVSTDILELRRFPKYIFISDSARRWIFYLRQLSKNGWSDASRRTQRQLAREQSWHQKLVRIGERISL